MTLPRLQLAVGPAATLIAELPGEGSCRLFSARAPHESADAVHTRLVVLHPPPPEGPPAGALLDRMALIRAAAHPSVAAPLATGDLDGAAWVVEPVVPPATIARRAGERGGLTTAEVIAVMRDTARALLALHRRGVSHGALSADAIALHPDHITLHRLGRSVTHDPDADWRALGQLLADHGVAQRSGRHPLPVEVEALIALLADSGAEAAPVSGSEVLALLDRFPTGPVGTAGLVDGMGRGVRSAADRRALLIAGIAGMLVVIWFLFRGR